MVAAACAARLVLGERHLRLLHHPPRPLPLPSGVAADSRICEVRRERHRQRGLLRRLSLGAERAAVADWQGNALCTLSAEGEVACEGVGDAAEGVSRQKVEADCRNRPC